MDSDTIISIVIMAFLVLFSAYFSATETAFSTFNKTRVKTLAEAGNKRAALVLALNENYDKLISTVLIGNNIVNIALASIGTVLFVKLYGDIGATVSTAVVTVAVLIFGEISPKSLAKDYPEKFTMFSAPFINALIFHFTPLNVIFSVWKKFLSLVFKSGDDKKMSQEELLMLVQEVEEDGAIDNEESELIRNVIEFGDRKAEDILTHRGDVEAVSVDTSKKEIARIFSATKFSRLPVYEESIDNIIGVIHQKDFYNAGSIFTGDIHDILTEPIFVSQSMNIDALLKELKMSKSHIAVAVDEYGGMVGIVTMEDILEELVGEIWDEHDDVTEDFKEIAPNTYRVDGLTGIDDFADFFDCEIKTENVSFGGWVMEMLDKIPEEVDKFSFENLDFTVTEIDNRRAKVISVVMHPEEKAEEEE
ncbi:MAG: HlyC/CorC family transporter [Clostridia bacterium]|nr:HlyC/CorC family transporter [Clostridia bacterium]